MKTRALKISEILDALQEEYPIYGDFLRYYSIRIGEMPLEVSANLLTIGIFYEKLKNITRGMLNAYIRLALLKKGFISTTDLEIYADPTLEIDDIYKEVTEFTVNDILGGYYNEFEEHNPEDYVNIDNHREGIRVYELTAFPIYLEDSIVFVLRDIQHILVKLKRESNIPRLAKFVIIDPLVYRLLKEETKNLKRIIAKEIGRDIILNIYEFLDVIGIKKEEFDEEWSEIRERTLRLLKKDFPFLSLYDELERIKNAKENLKYARSLVLKSELTRSDCEDIVMKASKCVESLLNVMFHASKGYTLENITFGQLLNELRSEITIEFGEDVYKDLDYIRERRNIVAHSKPVKISREDAIKTLKKAELFFDLFFLKNRMSGE